MSGSIRSAVDMRTPIFYENGTSLASKYLGINSNAASATIASTLTVNSSASASTFDLL